MELLLRCFRWQPAALMPVRESSIGLLIKSFKALMVLLALTGVGLSLLSFLDTRWYKEEWQKSPSFGIHAAAKVAFVTTSTLMAWSFWCASHVRDRLRHRTLIILGLIDVAFAVMLIVGIWLQGRYVPSTVGESGDSVKNALCALLAEKMGDTNFCQFFTALYILHWFALCFQVVVAYIEIFSDPRPHSWLHPKRPAYVLWETWAFVCGHLYYWCKYFLALRRSKSAQEETELQEFTRYTPRAVPAADVEQHKLVDILTLEHILLSVAGHLCHEDVVNLGLTSRAVREAVFPARDLGFRLPKLRKACCSAAANTRESCAFCNKVTCSECRQLVLWPHPPADKVLPFFLSHLHDCWLCCPGCFRSRYCPPRVPPWRPCHCRVHKHGRPFSQPELLNFSACRTCSRGNSDEILERYYARRKRRMEKYYSGRTGDRVLCEQELCWEELESGVVFWICGRCDRPCSAECHPNFYDRREGRDGEEAVGA